MPLGDELALLVKLYDEFSTSLTFPKIHHATQRQLHLRGA
jgi:hypothetical protein